MTNLISRRKYEFLAKEWPLSKTFKKFQVKKNWDLRSLTANFFSLKNFLFEKDSI